MKDKNNPANDPFFSIFCSFSNEITLDDLFYCIKYIPSKNEDKTLSFSRTLEERVKEKILTKHLETDSIVKDEEFGEIMKFRNIGDVSDEESSTYIVIKKPLYDQNLNIQNLFKKRYKEWYKELFEPSNKQSSKLFIERLFNNNTYYTLNEEKFNILYGFLNGIELEDIKDLDYKAVKNVCHRMCAYFPKDYSLNLIKDIMKDENYKNF